MQSDLFDSTSDQRSITIIQHFEPPEGYWLAFSGGKDSVVILHLAEHAGVKFDAHYNNTTCDPPELVHFIRRECPRVKIENAPESIYHAIVRKGPPLRTKRWCCSMFKERGGKGRVILTGIRDQESGNRRRRRIVEHCTRRRSTNFVHPIKFWKEHEVWDYIKEHSIPYCSLYDQGFRRLGCVICPFASDRDLSMERWPKIWKATRRSLDQWYAQTERVHSVWSSSDALWKWWLNRKSVYDRNRTKQLSIFQ